MVVKAKTEYTKKALYKFAKFNAYKKTGQIMIYLILELSMAAFASVFIFTAESARELMLSIVLIAPLFLLMIPLILLITPASVAKMSENTLGSVNEYEFTENEVVVNSTLPTMAGQTKANYHYFDSVYETMDAFYLFVSKQQAFILNKSDITEGSVSALQYYFGVNLPSHKYFVRKSLGKRMSVPLLLALFLYLPLILCSALKFSVIQNMEQATQKVTSSQSSLFLAFPKSWKGEEMHEIASIEMANNSKDQYLIVIEENSEDFSDDFTVHDYTDIIKSNMMERIEITEDTPISDMEIGNSIRANQFELAGIVDRIKIKYLVTCAKVDNNFCQFIAWSIQSKYNENKPDFDKILRSVNVDEQIES